MYVYIHTYTHTYIHRKEIIKYNLPSNLLFHLSPTSTQPQRKRRPEENKPWMVLPPPPSASLTSLSPRIV